MMQTKEHTIEAGILALASVDEDHARYANSVGFNGRDTAFGNSLAFQLKKGKQLSARQKAAAYRMLRTYKTQLLRDHGIDWHEIPQPDVVVPAGPASVTGDARMEHGAVVVKFSGFPGDLLTAVKQVPGARYNRETQDWSFALTPHTAPYIEAFPPAIRIGDDVKTALRVAEEAESAAMDASRAVEADIELSWADQLYGFQRAGVAYAIEHGRTLIGDEMGLGKTVQALATLEVTDAYPALIVVPAVVKLNWQREARRWVPGRDVHIVEGRSTYKLPKAAEIVVVNYDLIPYWGEHLTKAPWKAVIFDESHYLKNAKAKRTKAAKAIAHTIPLRLLLTGTPVLNRPIELASQLEIMGRLGDFGGFWAFANRYCNARKGFGGHLDLTGASNLEELHDKLRATCFVRRTKAQVLGDLPPKQKVSLPVEFDRTHYEEVAEDLKVWLKQRILADDAFRAKVKALSEAGKDIEAEALAWQKERSMGRARMLVMIEALKQAAAEGKLDPVSEWIREFLDAGRKLVVFAHHKSVVSGIEDRIRQTGYGVVTLTGETKPEDRQRAVDRFQTEEECRLFIGNMQAAGVGITLTAASDVCFVELPWRPGDLTQAEDRCHRIGQEDSVTCWYLLAANTIEERIARMIDAKRQVVDAATDGKIGLAAGESIADALMDALEKEAKSA